VVRRDVVDELHDDHRLADAGAAEEPDLAALRVGREEVDDLDACVGERPRSEGFLGGEHAWRRNKSRERKLGERERERELQKRDD
jgi:hypothetical protein